LKKLRGGKKCKNGPTLRGEEENMALEKESKNLRGKGRKDTASAKKFERKGL